MAIVTRRLGAIRGGAAFIEVDFDDIDNRARTLRWQNSLPREVLATVVLPGDLRALDVRLAAGGSGTRALPGNQRWNLEDPAAWPAVNLAD